MNEIVSKFLLTGDKFMSEMPLRFTYSACGPFTKNKESIQKFKETGDSRYIYQNKLDKDCFQHGMAYGDFKDLTRRTASDKILPHKAFNIAENWIPRRTCFNKKVLVLVLKMRRFQTNVLWA